MESETRPAQILLVEDNEGDVLLTKLAFEESKLKNDLDVVEDGDSALDYLFKRGDFKDAPTPDLILLDLNLPGTNGLDVLEVVKNHTELRRIPVIVLTSSDAESDVVASYNLHANCYIVKPVNGPKFIEVLRHVENFWVEVVCTRPSSS